MKHISFDIETWGKKPGCDIRSIGAVVFIPESGVFKYDSEKQFYIATDNQITNEREIRVNGAEPEYKYPLTRDPETVKWWNDQGEEAQAAFANPVDLRDALKHFTSWICNLVPIARTGSYDRPPDDIRLWANHSHFDAPILAAAFHAVGLPVPWHYRAPHDMPTITEAASMTHDDFCNYGVPHNALDDAIAQAMTICKAYKLLGLQRP